MSNEQFRVFTNPEFGATVRVAMRNGEYWFMARDVCDYLELGNISRALDTIDAEDKLPLDAGFDNCQALPMQNAISCDGMAENNSNVGSAGDQEDFYDSSNGGRSPIMLSEAGMYDLILKSRKPAAKAFKHWVTHEVLPELRKTGAVALNDVNMEVVKELGESTRQLAFVTNRLTDMSNRLGAAEQKYRHVKSQLRKLQNPQAPVDVLLDPKKYWSAFEVFRKAGYFMRKENDNGNSITALQVLLYNTSVADGYPIMIYRHEFVFHKDIADKCLKIVQAKATPKDIDLAFMPGAREKAGLKGSDMSSVLKDTIVAEEEPEDDDLEFNFDI